MLTTAPQSRAVVPCLLMVLSAGGLCWPHLATAQSVSLAPAAEWNIEIPAGNLGDALHTLAKQVGLVMAYKPDLVTGLSTPGLQGRFTAARALALLLQGSDLDYRFADASTVTLMAASHKSEPLRLESIRVTGELQERSLQESQSSVSTLTQDVIDSSNITSLEEIFQRTPNVSGIFSGEGFAIRGVPDRGIGSGLGDTSATTAVYIDGAVQSINGGINGILSTWDLQQVEVFRGPQTTAQGRSALAGSVIIRSRNPEYEWGLRARISAGEDGNRQYATAFGGPLIEDTLAFRIAADLTDTDGFTRFENGEVSDDDIGRDKRELYRGKLLFEPNDAFSALLTLVRSDAERGSDMVTGTRPFSGTRNTVVDISDTEVTSHVLELTYTTSEQMTFTATTSYTDLQRELFPIAATLMATGTTTTGLAEDKTLTQELRLAYDSGDARRATLGVYYADLQEESARLVTGTQGPFSIVFNDGFDNSFENFAVFGEVEFDVSQYWTLLVGGRYDREDSDRTEFASSDITPDTPALPDGSTRFSGASSFDALLPKLAAIYHINDDLSVSLTVQRAYRPGGADIRTDTNAAIEFDPEYTWNYDLALRSLWQGGSLFANVNLFYIDYTDMQLRFSPDPALPFVRFIDNAGEAEIYGLELETGYQVSEKFRVYGSLAWTETEFGDFQFQGLDLSGREFPYAANISVSFGGTYRWSSGISLTLDNIYTGDYYSSLVDERNSQVSSHFLTNLRAGFERDNWAVYGYIANLFDKAYLTDRFQDPLVPADSNANLGQPRTAGVILEFSL